MERVVVAHHGVPIGSVELPERRRWAGGPLEPFDAYAVVRPTLAAVASKELALRLLMLPSGDAPTISDLSGELGIRLLAAAALGFELVDSHGGVVGAEVVGVAETGDDAPQVRAHFRRAEASVPAVRPG